MTWHKFSILILSLLFFVNIRCKTANERSPVVYNDTTEILRLLFDSAFINHSFPNENRLTTYNPFGDTIVVRYDSISAGHLPTNYKIKLLSLDEICSIAKEYFKDTSKFWSYVEIESFEKLNNTYEVNLCNFGIMSVYDKNGKKIIDKKFSRPNIYCLVGYKCADVIRMKFTKDNDSLKAKVEAIWSD